MNIKADIAHGIPTNQDIAIPTQSISRISFEIFASKVYFVYSELLNCFNKQHNKQCFNNVMYK